MTVFVILTVIFLSSIDISHSADCEIDSGSRCLSCKTPGGRDCELCKDGSYVNNDTQLCNYCPSDCTMCESTTKCTECRVGYELVTDPVSSSATCKKCGGDGPLAYRCSKCEDGQPENCIECSLTFHKVVNGICLDCGFDCDECKEEKMCDKCSGNTVLVDKTDSRVCERCGGDGPFAHRCSECEVGHPENCIECKFSSDKLVNGTCLRCGGDGPFAHRCSECEDGHPENCIECKFSSDKLVNGTCLNCGYDCDECEKEKMCAKCSGNNVLVKKTDSIVCERCGGSYSYRCNKCADGSPETCIECKGTYVLINGKCELKTAPVPAPAPPVCGGSCNKCADGSPETCIECSSRYVLVNGKCERCGGRLSYRCKECADGLPETCIKCYSIYELVNGICEFNISPAPAPAPAPPAPVQRCGGDLWSRCNKCKDGSTECGECYSGYTLVNGECINCGYGCTECVKEKMCAKCSNRYVLVPTSTTSPKSIGCTLCKPLFCDKCEDGNPNKCVACRKPTDLSGEKCKFGSGPPPPPPPPPPPAPVNPAPVPPASP